MPNKNATKFLNQIESGDDSRDSLVLTLTLRKRHMLSADLNNDEHALDSDDEGSDEDPSVCLK